MKLQIEGFKIKNQFDEVILEPKYIHIHPFLETNNGAFTILYNYTCVDENNNEVDLNIYFADLQNFKFLPDTKVFESVAKPAIFASLEIAKNFAIEKGINPDTIQIID